MWQGFNSEKVYMLTSTGFNHVKLVCLDNGRGRLTDAPIEVKYTDNLTSGDWKRVRGGVKLSRIYHVEIKAEQE